MIKNKKDIHNKIKSIDTKIANAASSRNPADITDIRLDILSLLEEAVKFYIVNDFNTWEKDYLSRAISHLRWNIDRKKHDTFMLAACLFAIYKSSIQSHPPTHSKNTNLTKEITQLTEDDFFEVINQLKYRTRWE